MSAIGTFNVVAGPVTVTNVTASQQPGLPLVDISYDLLNPSGGVHTVLLFVSTNSGATYLVGSTNFTGAVGAGVTTGAYKQIVWFAAGDFPFTITSQAHVRVTATETPDMVLIPAGAFIMGDTFSEENSSERPTHSVFIGGFYIDKTEVTKVKWDEVYNWGASHGYLFDHAGLGKAPTHPVQTVSWYDCVKWCNARSEMEGVTPCYYLDAAQTVLYKTGQSNVWSDAVNWTTNGYRLPTEAEWEKAARGGTAGHRFPWSDVEWIDFTRANYYSYWSGGVPFYSYDHAAQEGNNPTFAALYPYTSPVGYFAPNGYGLYDMAGNVWEWCWDWRDDTYYASSPGSDPRGGSSSTYRVLRGGFWSYLVSACRVASRGGAAPGLSSANAGFRCVRGL